MHAFGHPADIERLVDVCARHGLPLVEDAAEALGSTWRGRHCGTFGTVGTLSFNGNKVVTTGGGGAVLTNDPAIGQRAKHLSTTAKVRIRGSMSTMRWGSITGCPISTRRSAARSWSSYPASSMRNAGWLPPTRMHSLRLEGVSFVREPPGSCSNYWLNAIVLDASESLATRDIVLERLNRANFMARPAWTLMHRLAPYAIGAADGGSVRLGAHRAHVDQFAEFAAAGPQTRLNGANDLRLYGDAR